MIINIYNKIKWQTYIMDVQVEFGLWSVNSFINCQEVHHGILSRINCKLHVFSRLIRTISICWNVYLLKKKKVMYKSMYKVVVTNSFYFYMDAWRGSIILHSVTYKVVRGISCDWHEYWILSQQTITGWMVEKKLKSRIEIWLNIYRTCELEMCSLSTLSMLDLSSSW